MNSDRTHQHAHITAEAVARRSYGKLVAFLAAKAGDVAAAEDALSDAFAAALTTWPDTGCPVNPEAWLLTVARRKFIDQARRHESSRVVDADLNHLPESEAIDSDGSGIPDRRLALMFACAHPAIDASVHSALILQTVLGLNAKAIASAFLASPAAIGKRLVRAKDKIRQAGIPFRIPDRDELPARLAAVLDAIYAAFSLGWSDPGGADAARRELVEEAIFLARVVVDLLPSEPEAQGLLSLMLHAEARRSARRNSGGEYVPLAEQNPALWNASMIAEAEALLLQAASLGAIGRYQLEAAIQSAHVERRLTGRSNWADIVALYDTLHQLACSPVVAINRALAIAALHGGEAALSELDRLASDPRLAEYQPWWAARADLLAKAGASAEALRAYEIAIGLERDSAVRRFLENRKDASAV
jgi:predicted RNA polymerase sigma factor